jgi:ElaB/YqjD/DUF883 family membrane-anchored ribosome-binding protein
MLMNEIKPNLGTTAPDLKESVSTVKETVSKLVDQGSEAVEALKSRANEVEQEVRDRGAAALEHTSSFVQANPFASVAIAFAIGYVAMRLRTSMFVKLGLVAGLGYLGNRAIRR